MGRTVEIRENFATVDVRCYEIRPLIQFLRSGMWNFFPRFLEKTKKNSFVHIHSLSRMCYELQYHLDKRYLVPRPALLTNLSREEVDMLISLKVKSAYCLHDFGLVLERAQKLLIPTGKNYMFEADKIAKGFITMMEL